LGIFPNFLQKKYKK